VNTSDVNPLPSFQVYEFNSQTYSLVGNRLKLSNGVALRLPANADEKEPLFVQWFALDQPGPGTFEYGVEFLVAFSGTVSSSPWSINFGQSQQDNAGFGWQASGLVWLDEFVCANAVANGPCN
jgi:hypothetical protein